MLNKLRIEFEDMLAAKAVVDKELEATRNLFQESKKKAEEFEEILDKVNEDTRQASQAYKRFLRSHNIPM